jgi:nitrate/TMAO reductase-like tetraheme cytochrome c subunit
MKTTSKQNLIDHITRTYWSFWLWGFLTTVGIVNLIAVTTLFSVGVLLLNITLMVQKYHEHKALRAEYDRRYAWKADSSADQSKEAE